MAAFYSCLRGKNRDRTMASGPAASIAACESSEVAEESPAGKKKSRFQTFKNFFAKKKRKEAASPVADDGVLKTSQSSDDVNHAEPVSVLTDQDSDSGSNIKLENKALSQDSVFASDSPCSETNEVLGASQDCIHGKVKSLQLQLKQTIRLGCPTGSGRQAEESTTLSEDDGLPYSPLEDSSFNAGPAASSQRSSGVGQRTGSLSLEGSDTDDDQMSNGASSRPSTPQATIPADFSDPASSLSCLDSSAARHRIAVNTRACAKRKPASREMLQTKKRDLRGRLLLRDTEDKLRAAGEFTEGEENQANVSEDTEEEVDTLDESPLLEQTEEASPTSTRSQTSSRTSAVVECSEEEEGVLHKDHNPGMEFLESSWDGPVTLELQADDFLLDTGCDGASEEQGSLLEEVLSSLKGPLTSGLVLEPSDGIEEMEVEDATVEYVPDILAEDTSTNLLDFTDRSLTLEQQIMPDENTFFKTAEYLNEVEDTSENEPVKQEFSEETPHEDSQVSEGEPEGEYDHEEEEKQGKRKDVGEEVCEAGIIKDVDEVSEEEPENENMEENRKEEVGWENKEDEDNYVDEAEKMLDEDSTEEVAEDTMEDEQEESGISDEACPPEKELEINVNNTTIEDECFHDSDQCVQVEALDSMEVLNQPEDHPESPAHETAELPSFVVTTSVDLSFPSRVSDIPMQIKQREDKTETLQEEASEPHVILERLQDWTPGSPQLADEHQEMMSGSHQPNSRPRFTITPAWQKSLSGGTVKELSQPVEPSAADEPAFIESTSSDQSLDDVKAERSSSPFQSRSAPPLPLPRETGQAQEETTPENPFGVRLRKTPVLHRYAFEGENPAPATQTDAAETQKAILEQLARKPALPKKPDQVIESAMKPRRSSDLVVGKTSLENSEAPSWISVARQKQKVFKENSLEESFESKVADEEFKTRSLSDLSSPVTKDVSSLLKPVASPVKVACSLEMSKTSMVEKESKRTASHMPPAPLAHEEPPWLALAKKKAKAWSEMPQIVQ